MIKNVFDFEYDMYIYIYIYIPNTKSKFETTNTVLGHIITIPPKTRSDNFRRILEGIKKKDLRKLASNATDELKTCNDTKKRWFELIIVVFSNKVFKTEKKVQKKPSSLYDFGVFPSQRIRLHKPRFNTPFT